jgi:hypothetical protein
MVDLGDSNNEVIFSTSSSTVSFESDSSRTTALRGRGQCQKVVKAASAEHGKNVLAKEASNQSAAIKMSESLAEQGISVAPAHAKSNSVLPSPRTSSSSRIEL